MLSGIREEEARRAKAPQGNHRARMKEADAGHHQMKQLVSEQHVMIEVFQRLGFCE